jgi:thiosulfate/3-mercaptopyruvate sulfurtransferase
LATKTFVSTEWLFEHLNDANLRIVDIRGHVLPASDPPPHYFNHREAYDKAHIPGAVFVDWVKEITDPDDPRHAKIAKPERYAAAMSRLGIGPETLVVAYDDAGGMFAARLYWSLNYYGHENVVVLDGGWDKWIAEGQPVTAEMPQIAPTEFHAVANPSLIRTADQVLAATENPGSVLLDVRTPAEFAGQFARAPRKGHIPGAANLPRNEMLTSDGTLKPIEAVREQMEDAGVSDEAREIVCYCNGGVSASYGFLTLRALGYDNAAVYDGSWKEWGNDASKPIE